ARIYGINTAGAFVGTLAAGFYLLPELGFPVTMRAMSALNVLAGIGVLLIGSRLDSAQAPPEAVTEVPADSSSSDELPPRRARAAAFTSGFVSLAVQTIFVRIVGLTMGSSE